MSIELPAAEKFFQAVDDTHGRIKRCADAMDIIDQATGLRGPDEKEAFMQVFFDLRDEVTELGKAIREYHQTR